jgi:hypothetical protein
MLNSLFFTSTLVGTSEAQLINAIAC